MTLLALGWAAEYADAGHRVQLPVAETYIATSAVTNMADGTNWPPSRSPEIMADAAVEILSRPAAEATGKCYIDAESSPRPASPTVPLRRRRRPHP